MEQIKTHASILELEPAPLCKDYDEDCTDLNHCHCWIGGFATSTCCNRLVYFEPVEGYCPFITKHFSEHK